MPDLDVIQAQYENLEGIAQRFGQRAEAHIELHSRVERSFQALEQGGWEGKGAEGFTSEMNGEVFPAMQRLIDGLEEAQSVTLQIKDILQKAEEEAASVFRDGGGSSAGGSAAPPASIPDVVETPPGTFDDRRIPYTIGPAQEVPDHPFRSGTADALRYDVEVGGRTIPVYVPKDSSALSGSIHTIDEVAKGLAALPEPSRNLVVQVNVEPGPNPDDAYWAQEYNDPNFSSYMTAGPDGVIDIYPASPQMSQDYLDGTMVHETGHIWSAQNWGSDANDARWNDWKAAMGDDPSVASKYAKAAPSEDFSETLQLYYQVRGTPEEAAARSRMPARFKIIDDILAGRR